MLESPHGKRREDCKSPQGRAWPGAISHKDGPRGTARIARPLAIHAGNKTTHRRNWSNPIDNSKGHTCSATTIRGRAKFRPPKAAWAKLIGVPHCLAVNSCTSALICAYRALGIGAGDEVIVPAYTFFASAATVVAANAIPVIVEVDETLCLDPEAVEKAITHERRPLCRSTCAVRRLKWTRFWTSPGKGLPVVEDVAQAGGGSFQGKRLGSLGTLGCFSFDYYKVQASGEGGFVTTNDEWLYTRAQSWHDTAACWRPDRFSHERKAGELFCGENYRMSELQGAVALAQIRKTDAMLAGYRHAHRRIQGSDRARHRPDVPPRA